MTDLHGSIEGDEEAYGAAAPGCRAVFRGLCAKFQISSKCFASLVEDGWDDPSQFEGIISTQWKDRILALAPNGGQKRNLERMLERVEAGPLDKEVPKKKANNSAPGSVPKASAAITGDHAEAGSGNAAGSAGKPTISPVPSTSQCLAGKIRCTIGRHIHLKHPKSPQEPAVAFGAHLSEIAGGGYVLGGIEKESRAHSVGLRNGDQLIGVNATNIEGRGVPYLLKLLRHEVLPHILLQVKRPLEESERNKFVCTFFELGCSTHDGALQVTVKGIAERDDDVIPWTDICESFEVWGWLGPPVDSYDIWVGGKTPRYLGIYRNGLGFGPFERTASPFYRYNFSSPIPANGSVVAYSKYYFREPRTTKPTTLQAKLLKRNPVLQVSPFQEHLLDPTGTMESSQLFYEHGERNGTVVLEATGLKGMYVAKSNSKAILSPRPAMLNIGLSVADDLGGCDPSRTGQTTRIYTRNTAEENGHPFHNIVGSVTPPEKKIHIGTFEIEIEYR